MTELTFVTAVGPYHTHLIDAVRDQVEAQTVKCQHIVITDDERRGPGAVRNAGLAQADTPFVAFLDADDQIAPTWAAETLAAFAAHGGKRYVYTDHVQDDRVIAAPEVPWVNGTWHVITTLVPTAWWRSIGGFDPTLPAFEDTDAYLRLRAHGYWGARLARPLFLYGPDGQRSATHHNTPVEDVVRRYFTANYGGRTVGCCGDVTPNTPPSGDRQDGDVLARAIYGGNRRELGRATGRLYPRVGNGAMLWMDARDIAASPSLWRAVQEQEANATAPDFDFGSFADYAAQTGDHGGTLTNVEEVAAFFMAETQPPADYEPPPVAIHVDAAPGDARPSAAKIAAKAQRGRKRGSAQRTGAVAAKAETRA